MWIMAVPSYLQLLSQIDVFGEEVISVIALLQERQADREKIEEELTKALALECPYKIYSAIAAAESRKRKYRDIDQKEEEGCLQIASKEIKNPQTNLDEANLFPSSSSSSSSNSQLIISADNFKTNTRDKRVNMGLINELRQTILIRDVYCPKWTDPHILEDDVSYSLNSFLSSLLYSIPYMFFCIASQDYPNLYRNAFKHSLMLYDSLQKKNKVLYIYVYIYIYPSFS